MKKKTFLIIIILMSIALCGIIVVQILWVKNAININEKQFEQNVFTSFEKIILELKTESAIKLDNELWNIDESLEVTVGLDGYEKVYNISTKNPSDNIDQAELSKLEKILDEFEFDYIKNPLGVLNLNLLDTIIKNELLNTGIDLKCEFAVVFNDTEIIYQSDHFSESNLNSKFKAIFFIEKPSERDYYLYLYFPQISKSIYKSVFSLLILSILFTLIILATFIIAVGAILKQKKLSEIKTDFINNITHELKTPIATLKIAISTLKHDKIFSKNETVQLIERQGNRLQIITDRVIDNSFNNPLNIKTQKVNANNYIAALIKDFEQSIDNLDTTIEYQNDTNNKSAIEIDEEFFTPAIINILDNAVKYNDKPNKKIVIKLTKRKDIIVLEIEDNGTGISDKNKKMIFEKFYRGITGNIHNVKGLGIGLFFTKQIIELHNGTITYESKIGFGTKFILKLKAK